VVGIRAGRHLTLVALVALVVGGCGGGRDARQSASPSTGVSVTTAPAPTADAPEAAPPIVTPPATSPSTSAAPPPSATALSAIVEVRYRIENRSPDQALVGFAADVARTLADERGWQRARYLLVHDATAPYAVVLAEPDDAQELCRPYDVYRRYSCQNGPVVVLNAERWRTATPQWTGDLPTYREMLVNHEFGHLLGMRHPAVQCPRPGEPAAVMAQQSTELDGCLPNPWPLSYEIERAARHDQSLAPAYGQ
jgi:hypothetical protein